MVNTKSSAHHAVFTKKRRLTISRVYVVIVCLLCCLCSVTWPFATPKNLFQRAPLSSSNGCPVFFKNYRAAVIQSTRTECDHSSQTLKNYGGVKFPLQITYYVSYVLPRQSCTRLREPLDAKTCRQAYCRSIHANRTFRGTSRPIVSGSYVSVPLRVRTSQTRLKQCLTIQAIRLVINTASRTSQRENTPSGLSPFRIHANRIFRGTLSRGLHNKAHISAFRFVSYRQTRDEAMLYLPSHSTCHSRGFVNSLTAKTCRRRQRHQVHASRVFRGTLRAHRNTGPKSCILLRVKPNKHAMQQCYQTAS